MTAADDGDARAVDELVGILGLTAERPSPDPTACGSRVPPPRTATPAPPPTGKQAAVALVAALRRRRDRAVHDAAPEGADAVLSALASAVHRLRILGRAEAVVRAVCDEAAAVTGLERVALSAPGADGRWRVLHATDGGTTPPAGLAGPPDDDPAPFTTPGSAAATAIATGRPASADSPAGPARRDDDGRGAPYVVVPFPGADGPPALLHAVHEPPRPVDAWEVAALAAFAAVVGPVWHGSAVADRWEQRVAAMSDHLAGLLAEAVVGDDRFLSDDGEESDDGEPRAGGPADRSLPTDTLTAREQVVLSHLLAGAANREIAEALVLSVDTVKTHVKKILRKLGVGSRAELISRTYRGPSP